MCDRFQVTAQVPDDVRYDGSVFALCGVRGGPLFEPGQHGLETYARSTANYRGFVATYEVEDTITLTSVVVGEDAKFDGRQLRHGEVVLGGIVRSTGRGDLRVEGVDLHVDLTGRLLLGEDFVPETYAHMGFQAGWRYRRVLDLEFEAGRVLMAVDRSAHMAVLRDSILSSTTPDPDGALRNEPWIQSTFTLDYSRSALG